MRDAIGYYRGIGREATLILLASSVGAFWWGVYIVIPSVFFPQVGLSDVQIGSLYSANGLTSAIVGIPLAILADRYGRKKALMIGIALGGVSFFIYAITTNYAHLLAASFVSGLGFGLYFPSSNALLAERTSEPKRMVAFSLSFFVSATAEALGTMFSVIPAFLRSIGVGFASSYQLVYALSGVIFLCGLIPAFLVKESVVSSTTLSMPRKSASMILRFSIVNTIIGLGAGLIIPIFSLWFYTKFHYDETVLGPLNTVATIATAFSGLVAPKLAERMGDVPSVLVENGIATLTLLIMPSIESFSVLSILFIIRQFLMNMSAPIMSAFYMSHVNAGERASASAISGTAWNFPNSMTPALGGYLMQNIAVDLPLYLCGTSYALGVLFIFIFFYGYRSRKAQPKPPFSS